MLDSTAPAVLEARDVTVRFGGVTALAGVTISLPPASLTGLVGPNGAGKSTLFAVLSGLLKPDSGRVRLSEKDITGLSPVSRARLGMARTFQQPEMFFGLTVRQHLVLAYRVHHDRSRLWRDMFSGKGFARPAAAEQERVETLLQMLSLDEVAGLPVDGLPLGTTRLVEVGRALAGDPRVVLLDEPLSGLDPSEAERLADVLARTVTRENISLLLVEHDVATVMRLSSQLYVLNFGELIAQGPPDVIRRDPAVRAAYLGDALGDAQGGDEAAAPDKEHQ